MSSPRELFDQLNRDYLAVHKTKEDLFWDTYMGISDDNAGFARAEQAYKDFISSPERLAAVRQALAELAAAPDSGDKAALQKGLAGWQALFECNILDSDTARDQMRELIDMESALFAKNRQHALTHLNEHGVREEATLGMLLTNMATNPDEAARKSSHDALLSQERWVLDNGFLDLLRQRNRLARALGYRNYFDYKVNKN
jgi:oligoendopeptidase F